MPEMPEIPEMPEMPGSGIPRNHTFHESAKFHVRDTVLYRVLCMSSRVCICVCRVAAFL